MSKILQETGNEKTVFSGQIIEVTQKTMSSGTKNIIFEKAIRSPGTRLIIINQKTKQILLTKEFRYEINNYDYRLPGGKVCNTLDEYHKILESNILENTAQKAAIKEAKEEVAINPTKIELFQISKSGGPTIEWDLYYYVVSEFKTLSKQKLELGENIEITWLNYKEAIDLCLSGEIKEDRTVGVLLKFFRSIKQI
jgi:ADP-ribose pyrophosphatase